MCRYVVNVQIYEQFIDKISSCLVRQIATNTLNVCCAKRGTKLDILVADDRMLTELNAQYRGINEVTDVLSFSFTHSGEYMGDKTAVSEIEDEDDIEFPSPDGVDLWLGEVVVSQMQAELQGEKAGHGPQQELMLLVAHGVLHLLGYDHEESEEAAVMKSLQDRVINLA